MATNKLMEAAAEILAGSKSSAPGMPMPKLASVTPGNSGTPEDLGGPTPQNNKPTDDSNKLSSKGNAKSASAPTTKPSAASSDVQLGDKNMKYGSGTNMMPEEEEYEDQDQLDEVSLDTAAKVYKKRADAAYDNQSAKNVNKQVSSRETIGKRFGLAGKQMAKGIEKKYDNYSESTDQEEYSMIDEMRAQMHEDMQALFSDDETISEDFKVKAATIFEARVFDRVAHIQEQMEAEYAGMLAEALEEIKSELTEKVDDYLNYVVEQWMEENEIAIESGLRSEITEDFIAGLRNLFAENYINVPEDKVELVDELASKVEELEVKLNEEIEANIQYKKQLTE